MTPTFHIWCLSPSVAFKELSVLARSVILTSGTLSPLDAMASELRVPFPQRLEADHVIGTRTCTLSLCTLSVPRCDVM